MASVDSFLDFKFSSKTNMALAEMGFFKPTKVQIKTIPYCLQDKDVVVQAKTGSGKTLAFLLPLVENLQKFKCSSNFGIQAVILVPTAELASQIFCILSKLLKYHPNITYMFTVGGKKQAGKKEEWKKIESANILVSTSGRLLEHISKNKNLDMSYLKYIVLDEADCLLEKNFADEMGKILNNFPKTCTTWLFSATQISTMAELKRLSIKNPVLIGLDSEEIILPKNLTQMFMKVELHEKLQALWNLLEAQKNSNIIVFFATQKQVLFMYRLFLSLNPPYRVLQLRSNMRLDKRVDCVSLFSETKSGCVLFTTDVSSRGLDFPDVSLVIQYDLPKEFDDYVHRAGRTARFNKNGASILMIMSSEIAFLSFLKEKNIILKQIRGNVLTNQQRSIAEKACMKYSSDLELFEIAKKSFLGYLRDYAKIPERFVSIQNSSEIFSVSKLPLKRFAKSLGFMSIPEEASSFVSNLSDSLTTVVRSDEPFFVVKRDKENSSKKRKLEVISDDEDSTNSVEEINGEEIVMKNSVKPAFVFEEALQELKSRSPNDKDYFKKVIKLAYRNKKSKLSESK